MLDVEAKFHSTFVINESMGDTAYMSHKKVGSEEMASIGATSTVGKGSGIDGAGTVGTEDGRLASRRESMSATVLSVLGTYSMMKSYWAKNSCQWSCCQDKSCCMRKYLSM